MIVDGGDDVISTSHPPLVVIFFCGSKKNYTHQPTMMASSRDGATSAQSAQENALETLPLFEIQMTDEYEWNTYFQACTSVLLELGCD
jgi:hypothetical protein